MFKNTLLILASGLFALHVYAQSTTETVQQENYQADLAVATSTSILQSIPELPYETEIVVSNLKMPDGMFLGEVAGVDLNSKGHIFVFTRTGEAGDIRFRRSAQLFEFDKKGKFVREITGPNFYGSGWAHSVRVDREDNIWIVDNGTHLISKFNPQGKLVMTLGRRPESAAAWGAADTPGEDRVVFGMMPQQMGQFYEPTDIAFDSKGNIFVSDGYKNSYVHKFDKDGHIVTRWGGKGSEPGQFNLPHSIAVGPNDNVYVADRSNNRIQIFDNDGNFLNQIKLDIRLPKDAKLNTTGLFKGPDGLWWSLWPNAICISRGPNPVIYTNDITPSVVLMLSLDGEILCRFGTDGRKVGQFAWMHEMACTEDDNEVYLSEMINMRVSHVRVLPTEE